MLKKLCGAIAFLALTGGLPTSVQAEPLPPDFASLPALFDAALSPDGNRVVTAGWHDGKQRIVVYDLVRNEPIFAGETDADNELRSVAWADDDIISFRASRTFRPGQVLPDNFRFRGAPTRISYWRDNVIDLATGRMRPLSTGGEMAWADQRSYLIAPIAGDSGYGRMVGRSPIAAAERPVVYRVNLRTGEARQALVRTREEAQYYVFDEDSVIARVDVNDQTNEWRLYAYDEDGADRPIVEGHDVTGDTIEVVGALQDGRLAAFGAGEEQAHGGLFAIDRATGARELIFSRAGYSIRGAIADPWSRRILGAIWTEVEDQQHFFDASLQSVYVGLRQHFPNGGYRLASWARDHSRFLIYAENGLDGGGYYVLTTASNQLRRLGFCYPAIAAAQVGSRQSISYRARDNTRIPAYLTTPAGREARGLPLVLLVHGGPAGRDDMNFDYWSTFLTSHGYAVLQPNFRGSSGYGWDWQAAGHGQWGGLMQTDVEDGVAALVRSGIADPNRVCIVGASYGGYAALAGATLTPDRYRCAVSIAGVSDLTEFVRQRQRLFGEQSGVADYWRVSIGDRQQDEQRLRETSPANLAERVRIPILLMHGTDDTVVPILQSRRMEDRLRAADKDVRFVELRGDDHWLSDAPTRIQMLRELEAFLAQHLATAPPAAH